MSAHSPGQLLLVGLPGPDLDAATAAALRRAQPGGYILFTRNIASPRQLRKLIDDLRGLSEVEPIVTIDQEGGRVSRLKAIGHEPPGATELRARNDVGLVERHGAVTGRLLRLFGFNLDLCPVLDFCLNNDETVDNSLRGRCYGVDLDQVLRLAGAFNASLRAAGIASCGKHFPGYTRAQADAHHELPTISNSRAELDALELAPYRLLGPELDSLMVCHAYYPALDSASGLPASLSPRIVTDLLRGELGYRGLVMTDDLDMGAIVNGFGFEQAIRLSIEAGNDLAMICHRTQTSPEALAQALRAVEQVSAPAVERALASVAEFKTRLAPPVPEFSEDVFQALDAEIWKLRVDTMGEGAARARSAEDGKRSPVEVY
jgi:beta-N-acetylhexosaminidase